MRADELLVQMELRDDVHSKRLVQAGQASEPVLVRAPVERDDGLSGDHFGVKQLHSAGHALWPTLPVFSLAARWVVILIKVKPSVATRRHEKFTVLREVSHAPNRGLVPV